MTRACTSHRLLRVAAVFLLCLMPSAVAAQDAPAGPRLVGGRNVNMAGGSQILDVNPATYEVRGDVLGRAQNEPSCAISTRNPQHILCGANDYRMVDVPGVTTTQIIRDAWLGEFQSADGGDTWESTLAGGFFLDPAPHPLRDLKFTAAADPVVRSGPAGLTFYAGIAFTSDKSRSALHLTTYADLNNAENDTMPFKRVRTVVVDQASGQNFIDKPWIYVEAAPAGQTCTINAATPPEPPSTLLGKRLDKWLAGRWPGWQKPSETTQRVPASVVHIVYTVFLDPNDSTAEIRYTRSDNCGQSFSRPVKLNDAAVGSVGLNDHGNGAAITKPFVNGARDVYITWRRVKTPKAPLPDAIMGVVSTNNGRTWSAPFVVEEICPFDQGTTAHSFRSTAFPTMAADGAGRVYLAWSDRRYADGACPAAATTAPDRGARIRIATSRDGRNWIPSSVALPAAAPYEPEHQILPSLAFTAGRLFLAWIDFKEDKSQIYGRHINEFEAMQAGALRHTGDVRTSMALASDTPQFDAATKISEYIHGFVAAGGTSERVQLQWNAVNRRWARRGTVPFNGDYIDIATRPYLPPDPASRDRGWRPNSAPTMPTSVGPVPVAPNILVAWADNRDMRSGTGVDTAPAVPFTTPNLPNLPATSFYDPTQVRPVCTPGSSYTTGTTNQNAYAARATIGFVAGVPGGNKALGTLQRTFVIFIRNDDAVYKTFRLAAVPPTGAYASFDQFVTTRTAIEVIVPSRSSVARTVYVGAGASGQLDPTASVRVDIIQMQGTTAVQGTSVMLNADVSAPEIESPEIESREIFTPEIESPEIESPEIESRTLLRPEIESPEIESPEIESAEWAALGLQRPEIESPEIESPEIESPEIESPEIESAALTQLSDVTFTVTNTGNTIGQYNAKAFVAGLPANARYQLIVRRRYEVPAVTNNCEPTTLTLSKVVVNIPDLQLGTPEIESPEIESSAPGTATFYLAPAEKADVVIRVRHTPQVALAREQFELAVAPEAVDSDDAAVGVTKPEVVTTYLSVKTTALATAQTGSSYLAQLEASGSDGALVWTLIGTRPLPDGLSLTPAGTIVGTPTVAGTFTFQVQATDASNQVATAELTIVVRTMGVPTLGFVTEPTDALVGEALSPPVSVRAFGADGSPAANVQITLTRADGGPLSGGVTRLTGPTGVAVFESLSVPAAATGIQLIAHAAGYAVSRSALFDVGTSDLQVTLTHTPLGPTTSSLVTWTAVVTNIGAAHVGASVLMLQLPGEVAGAEGTLIAIPGLAAGASHTLSLSSGPYAAGSYAATAQADFTNLIAESSETNNTAIDTVVVASVPTLTAYTNLADFVLATGAINVTGPLPALGDGIGSGTIGTVTFSAPDAEGLAIGGAVDWYPGLPGNDIALGYERLHVDFAAPQTAFGFFMAEPSALTMPPHGGSPVDSTFEVTLFNGAAVVGSHTLAALPKDQRLFFGFASDAPFTRATIVETVGSDDDEYFGEFYALPENPGVAFVVTTPASNGPGSLRQAILDANAAPAPRANSIVFALSGQGRHSIALAEPLPAIDHPLTIDATTQPGFIGSPIVEIDGSALALLYPNSDGLWIHAGGSTVRGLMINGFPRHGINTDLNAANRVLGNWIGLAADGETGKGNGGAGVSAQLTSHLNTIGGSVDLARNVISANGTGVLLSNGTGSNVVTGNYLGTDAFGFDPVPNTTGVRVQGSSGFDTIAGNLISGNIAAGVDIQASSNTYVRANIIGLDATGLAPLPNRVGVSVSGGGVIVDDTVIGGLNPGEGNVIAGNEDGNILLLGSGVADTIIQGNRIGVGADGFPLQAWVPQQVGINVSSAVQTIIGSTLTSVGTNVIGNHDVGIQLLGATRTRVTGNHIGVAVDGNTGAGNGYGLRMQGGTQNVIGAAEAVIGQLNGPDGNIVSGNATAIYLLAADGDVATSTTISGNRIGVTADGSQFYNGVGVLLDQRGTGVLTGTEIHSNVIGHSGTGVSVIGNATGNSVRGNGILNTGTIGIDLGDDGVTANDDDDGDSGPNQRQNFPVLTWASSTTGSVTGSLRTTAGQIFDIDVYSSGACHATGHGGGAAWLGTFQVTTNGAGEAPFTFSTPLVDGQMITATATDGAGNTSEFSACRLVEPGTGPFNVTSTANAGPGSLRQALLNANSTPGVDTITFALPTDVVITPTAPLPTITDAVVIDGTTQPGYSGTPIVELNGSAAGAGVHGLLITAGNSIVRGLVIRNFAGAGIRLQGGTNSSILGNYIGVRSSGAAGNGIGISIFESTTNTIGGTGAGNVISGNATVGVFVAGTNGLNAGSNVIRNNIIGLMPDGSTAAPNGSGGVAVEARDTFVGGTPDLRNVISGNRGSGVRLMVAAGSKVQGNYIGTNAAGTAAVGNLHGVTIEQNSSIDVSGNVLSGNAGHGVNLFICSTAAGAICIGNTISANRIGIAAAANIPVANGGHGIFIHQTPNNTIAGNTIGGNTLDGIALDGVDSTANVIRGNQIGISGATAVPNRNGIALGASSNTIGGTAADGNIVAFNTLAGIQLSGAHKNAVHGNRIGVDASGAAAGNGTDGVFLGNNATANVIGDWTSSNIIGANAGYGVMVGAATSGNTIRANYIGVLTDSTFQRPNGRGLFVDGSDNAVDGNVIRFNGTGVVVAGSRIKLQGNSISDNTGLGIDLVTHAGGTGVTPNDQGDADTGGNDFQNFPVITSAVWGDEEPDGTGTTRFSGTLNSRPSSAYTIQFFLNAACDISGHGEGLGTWVGTVVTTTDAQGNATFTKEFASFSLAGTVVTATALDSTGNTSEFSSCRTIVADTPGFVSGLVTDTEDAPLSGVLVKTFDINGTEMSSVTTGPDGRFATGALPTGRYYVRTAVPANGDYINQLYGGFSCWPSCTPASGTAVEVVIGTERSGVDFTLQRGGKISGRVSNQATGAAVNFANVRAFMKVPQDGTLTGSTFVQVSTGSGANGNYTLLTVPPGEYHVRTINVAGYITEFYNDVQCVGCVATPGEVPPGAATVTVTAGATIANIDFALEPAGSIQGTVTRSDTSAALNAIPVQVFAADGRFLASVNTNASGFYSTTGLPVGRYFVRTVASASTNSANLPYIDELYDDIACSLGCDVTSGSPITIAGTANVTNVNFALNPGARISGAVIDAATGAAIPPAQAPTVAIFSSTGAFIGNATVTGGSFTTRPLPSGTYYVRAAARGYQGEMYSDVACAGGLGSTDLACSVTEGTAVVITGATDATNIDFALERGSRIGGRIVDEEGNPVANRIGPAGVWIFDVTGNPVGFARTDAAGYFLSEGGYAAGTYYALTFNKAGLLDEAWDGQPCALDQCDVTTTTPIALSGTSDVLDLNFVLQPGGAIRATVTNASTGESVPQARVMISDAERRVVETSIIGWGEPHAAITTGLPPGIYYAAARDMSYSLIDGVWENIDCATGCEVVSGTPITITAGASVTNISFALTSGRRIRGWVTDADSGAGLPRVTVQLFTATGRSILPSTTFLNGASAGSYVTPALAPGTYYLRTSNTSGYLDESYGDISCPAGSCDPTLGTPVIVTADGDVSGINFVLARGARLTGRVLDNSTGLPLTWARVEIRSAATGVLVTTAVSGDGGVYGTTGLAAGDYRVMTVRDNYISEVYDDVSCEFGCDFDDGALISITEGMTTTLNDIRLRTEPN